MHFGFGRYRRGRGSPSCLPLLMLVPRRVRRRLVLPPGWVALGFLLLLGCQALQPWAGRLKRWNVMQITMPKLKLIPKEFRLYNDNNYSIPCETVVELHKIRPWHNAEFNGEPLFDFLNAATTESAIRKIIADTNHAGGVRIRFLPGATYANLVKALDIMNYTNQKKYWLDIHHQPTTLYAITLRQENIKRNVSPAYVGCCTCGPYLLQPSDKTAWRLEFQNLWLKNWRPVTLLLSLICILSFWRLMHYKPRYYNS